MAMHKRRPPGRWANRACRIHAFAQASARRRRTAGRLVLYRWCLQPSGAQLAICHLDAAQDMERAGRKRGVRSTTEVVASVSHPERGPNPASFLRLVARGLRAAGVPAGHRPTWLSDPSAPNAGIGATTTTPPTATGPTSPTALARFTLWPSTRSFSVVHQALTLRPRRGRLNCRSSTARLTSINVTRA